MTLDFLCNGRYLHLNFDVTSFDFHHHVTSMKAVIAILLREVITVRSLELYCKRAEKWEQSLFNEMTPTANSFSPLICKMVCNSYCLNIIIVDVVIAAFLSIQRLIFFCNVSKVDD
jgi:hypothetical protein